MEIYKDTQVSVSEANQDFPKDAPDEITTVVSDDDVMAISEKIMSQNRAVYEELAK